MFVNLEKKTIIFVKNLISYQIFKKISNRNLKFFLRIYFLYLLFIYFENLNSEILDKFAKKN